MTEQGMKYIRALYTLLLPSWSSVGNKKRDGRAKRHVSAVEKSKERLDCKGRLPHRMMAVGPHNILSVNRLEVFAPTV